MGGREGETGPRKNATYTVSFVANFRLPGGSERRETPRPKTTTAGGWEGRDRQIIKTSIHGTHDTNETASSVYRVARGGARRAFTQVYAFYPKSDKITYALNCGLNQQHA